MNRVILIGNLANDPETRTLDSGAVACNFRLAVQRRFANAQGERVADFFPVIAWNNLAKLCARYLSKGRKCAVEGQIQTRQYKAQDGTKRYVTEIVADNVEFLSPAPGSSGSAPAGDDHPPEASAFEMEPIDGDDLPF